jgi:hypothetical protein
MGSNLGLAEIPKGKGKGKGKAVTLVPLFLEILPDSHE